MHTIRPLCLSVIAVILAASPQSAFAGRTWMELAQLRLSVDEDVNFDGFVDSTDLSIILTVYGRASEGREDINQDGIVNSTDLAILFSAWSSDAPIVRLRHMSGDLVRRTAPVEDIFFLDVSPFELRWTRVWYRSSITHRAVSVDIPVALGETREILRQRGWDPLLN